MFLWAQPPAIDKCNLFRRRCPEKQRDCRSRRRLGPAVGRSLGTLSRLAQPKQTHGIPSSQLLSVSPYGILRSKANWSLAGATCARRRRQGLCLPLAIDKHNSAYLRSRLSERNQKPLPRKRFYCLVQPKDSDSR